MPKRLRSGVEIETNNETVPHGSQPALPAYQTPTPERSKNMAAIKSRDTRPEMYVRRALHSAGFRFRLHRKDLPGTPDIVLPRFRTAVLVQGCFWHGHGCRRGGRPKSNKPYWTAKIMRNIERDERNFAALEADGWRVVLIWECSVEEETKRFIDELCTAA